MNFKELLAQLEERLGYHQFPVNPAATNIKDVFEGSPLHHDMMIRLARAIYVSNACRRLTDPVNLDKTLQALAPIRQEVLRAARTDVDLYRVLDELGAAFNKIFAESTAFTKVGAPVIRRTAEIIPLSAYRHLRRLKSSA
ncbi:MAG: hypothetical protein A3E57_00270 [Candidatus Muproteobacteria bacterium RIFCSPHIGHO2_12_FULL_60_33]|nr:MAG: hypothetical protein A2W42_04400 [Candidatus Muproteobacteria bacterium RIFCSPHIGHO2_01_60_12]OGI53782.1 MAG: hypothetical protein A3D32_06710 [Candidatus Muproteobacteria bacterium RIFCSPHIGHO2_02_FULL_60_13]OGI55418.1 MAG: hypothetical protein A3E57_00270 [Candidatus Muproteobacteria bacterium RIFCSPHIGHO2_12_FULL_60_33]